MSGWIITSWVFVAAMTAINIFLFLKLKQASEQMLKMAFPRAKNMNEAMGEMQKMMGGKMPNFSDMGGLGNLGKAPPKKSDAQLKQAMALLEKKGKK